MFQTSNSEVILEVQFHNRNRNALRRLSAENGLSKNFFAILPFAVQSFQTSKQDFLCSHNKDNKAFSSVTFINAKEYFL